MTSFDFLEFFDLGVYKWMEMKFIYFFDSFISNGQKRSNLY
jgi:hypothetical protein